jgi:hypothetical protein
MFCLVRVVPMGFACCAFSRSFRARKRRSFSFVAPPNPKISVHELLEMWGLLNWLAPPGDAPAIAVPQVPPGYFFPHSK